MTKITRQRKTRRGSAICSKCGKEIKVGEEYLKAVPYRRDPVIRCLKCYLRQYELSNSKQVRDLGDIKYYWKVTYGINDGIIDLLIDRIETIKEDVEYNLYSMPEQFQDSSVLAERIEDIEDCLDELRSIDIDQDDLTESISSALSNLRI